MLRKKAFRFPDKYGVRWSRLTSKYLTASERLKADPDVGVSQPCTVAYDYSVADPDLGVCWHQILFALSTGSKTITSGESHTAKSNIGNHIPGTDIAIA